MSKTLCLVNIEALSTEFTDENYPRPNYFLDNPSEMSDLDELGFIAVGETHQYALDEFVPPPLTQLLQLFKSPRIVDSQLRARIRPVLRQESLVVYTAIAENATAVDQWLASIPGQEITCCWM